jgi:uncharacterized phiE125 gp8 family phage protein
MNVRIKTDLATEPVTVAEAKSWCKVTGAAEDALFPTLITAARQALEKYTGSSFGSKTIHATWVDIPDDWILELPYGPVIAISKVYRIDGDGTETELTLNDDYYVLEDGSIRIAQFWSSGVVYKRSVRVEYTAGYGDTLTETLPAELKRLVLKLINNSYQHRGDEAGGDVMTNEIKREAAQFRKKVWF